MPPGEHVSEVEKGRWSTLSGLIPADARVEMDAKVAAGYFTSGAVPDAEELKKAKGRELG